MSINPDLMKMPKRIRHLIPFLALLCSGLLLWRLTAPTQLLVNATGSLPGRAFLAVKQKPPKSGDRVSFQGHRTAYYPKDLIFTKRIIGVEGDRLTVKGRSIFLNGTFLARCMSKGQHGEKLTPIAPGIIKKGYVFVLSDHPRSFDSRYEEFGLVSTATFIGKTYKALP